MKKLMRDALIFVGGFAAGVATMHFLMRDNYKKQADVLVEDARNHFKQCMIFVALTKRVSKMVRFGCAFVAPIRLFKNP